MKLWMASLTLLMALAVNGQTKKGDRWVDNNLALKVTNDRINYNGTFKICIADTSRGFCVQNLTTGVKVKLYNEDDEKLWEGKASGRTKKMRLPEQYPRAHYLTIEAFRDHVTNKMTGTYIHQKEPLFLKYYIKK